MRLRQGDYAQEPRYGDDPLPRAQAFAGQGAQWMHLVDLDAARAGGYTLAPLLAQIRQQAGLHVQTGGGVRGRADLERILRENPLKGEYLLPVTVSHLLEEGKAHVTVLDCPEKWYGVTYREDRPAIVAAMKAKKEAGEYPEALWR